jgi:lipoyl-dependent peroxiredoxin
MDSLSASATLRWEGFHGTIEGGSGALLVRTATQSELGGPGGASNPEELFSAALANCFTSTLTSMARKRNVPLGQIETSVATRLSRARLRTQVRSPAAQGDVRALIAEAFAHCPVCQAVGGHMQLELEADVLA